MGQHHWLNSYQSILRCVLWFLIQEELRDFFQKKTIDHQTIIIILLVNHRIILTLVRIDKWQRSFFSDNAFFLVMSEIRQQMFKQQNISTDSHLPCKTLDLQTHHTWT